MKVKKIHESAFTDERWFAGKGRTVVRAAQADAFLEGALTLADVAYADGGAERYLLTRRVRFGPLVASLAAGPVEGETGRLELRAGPAFAHLAPCGPAPRERVPSTDQSNTLVAIDERLLVKAYRLLAAGPHPEVELCAALAGSHAPVPAYAGAVWHVDADGAETAIALLQEFVADADSGWEGPILRAVEALTATAPGSSGADPVAEYRAAGAAAAALHAALADACGTQAADAAIGGAWLDEARAVLDAAARVDAVVRDAVAEIAVRLGSLAGAEGLPLTRVHGDLHYAQYLRTPAALLVVDFEGDPTRPLAARRRPDTPLRDLACLLRSVDHIGQAASRRCDADPESWIVAATAAALEGYRNAAGLEIDPALLHALELAKACQELVYAAAVVPEWAYAPRAGLTRLLAKTPAGPR